jgi:hypothetical protein
VFAELAGIPYEDVLNDLPNAHLGTITVDGWTEWLETKGFTVSGQPGCPDGVVPCAHLVALADHPDYYHWIYRDGDGDIYDPSDMFAAMPEYDPWMRMLSPYQCKRWTISISR